MTIRGLLRIISQHPSCLLFSKVMNQHSLPSTAPLHPFNSKLGKPAFFLTLNAFLPSRLAFVEDEGQWGRLRGHEVEIPAVKGRKPFITLTEVFLPTLHFRDKNGSCRGRAVATEKYEGKKTLHKNVLLLCDVPVWCQLKCGMIVARHSKTLLYKVRKVNKARDT